jgi:hypothetical protein
MLYAVLSIIVGDSQGAAVNAGAHGVERKGSE